MGGQPCPSVGGHYLRGTQHSAASSSSHLAGAGTDSQASVLPGMDVLNEAIEKLTRGPGRECWTPSLISVSDTAMRVHPAQVGPGREGEGALG